MVRVLAREKSLRERVITIKPTARVERLRQRYLNTKDKAVIDILRIKTRVMKETEGEPREIRQAKAFAATVREMPLNIYPDELFVGWLFSEPRGSNITWQHALRMENELDTLSTREYMPFVLSDEDNRELREEIIPYWKAHHFYPPPLPGKAESAISYQPGETLVHWTSGYEKVLEKGILGVKRDAEERLARLDLTKPEDFKKLAFVQGVIIALEAASQIGHRFAARARELAEKEEDVKRKDELLKIAEVCDHMPAHPAKTFYEALQSVWFTHMLHAWDNENCTGMGPGRADQYLYPCYERDIREGRLTKKEAQELVDCWFMRFSQYIAIKDSFFARWMGPEGPGHHMDVGGLKPDGRDATNELSYMFIEAMMHIPGMIEPTLGLLVHSKTPEDLLIKGCQLTALGGGYPQFINQDLMVENLLARGQLLDGPPITLELARKGCCIGCHEPHIPNMQSGWGVWILNAPTALELVLGSGVRRSDRDLVGFHGKVGLETGDPRQFKSFEELKEAYRKQVAWQLRNWAITSKLSDMALQPKMFTSALTEDCIERGLSFLEGGARYNVGAVEIFGSVDAGNSLAAIKKLVFDDKKITMEQLCQALDKNFEGYEEIRKMCLEVPMFGNDDDYVDELVAWVIHVVTEEAKKYKTLYGGRMLTLQVPMAGYMPLGLGVGALPSGRLAGEPLCDGVSPTRGSDIKGPTAVLKSVGKIDNAEVSLGQTLNMKLTPTVFEKEDGFKRLADLVRALVDHKIDHIQFNVVSSDTLRAAQREPGKYKGLIIKVAGYNARFVELCKELQDSIIARTEHGL